MTVRIYWEDPYRREFDAHVVKRLVVEGRLAVVLDRTAFYPEGGGQPCDLGQLNGVAVLDVRQGDEGPLHTLAGELSDDTVHGCIDWPRRLDHMQQHTGQHILSQACGQTLGANTVGFHLGDKTSTIDLDRSDIGPEGLVEAEALANRVVSEGRSVDARLVSSEEELVDLSVRGSPMAPGTVRVVQIAGFDSSACGGTHLRNTAEVGLVKIMGSERHRGGTTRVSFLCGGRALADYDRKQKIVKALAAHFTTAESELLEAVRRLGEEMKEARRAQRQAQQALIESLAARLYAEAEVHGGLRIVTAVFDGEEFEAASVKALATLLGQRPGCIALLGWRGDKAQLTFARADDVVADVGKLMRMACEHIGGRGGGRPDWAQGGGSGDAPVAQALALAAQTVRALKPGRGEVRQIG
jgi:alanyl-tRNA synthetase